MATSSYEIKAGSLTMTEYAGQPTLGIAMKKRREVSVGRCVQATLLFALGVSPSAAADIHKDCQALQIAACTEVLRANPADTSALGNRGIGFRIAGQYDRAVADLTAAIDLNPRIAGFYLERGLAYESKEEHLLAIADLNEAIKQNPALVQAHFGKAMALEATGQHELSLSSLDNALGLDRNMVGALHMQRGYELRAAAHYDKAISAFDSAIDINPNWPLAYFGRGASFEDKGSYERAIEDYSKCSNCPGRLFAGHAGRRELIRICGSWARAWITFQPCFLAVEM
jgi:tetratricopeptide (TPR) repeat protein